MLSVIFLAATVSQATPLKVAFQDGAFTVSGAQGPVKVPVSQPTKLGPVDAVHGRFVVTLEKKTVVFDSKGLTLSSQGWTSNTKLKNVPVSGKVATKESNAALMADVKAGKKKLEVSALSGWWRKDTDLYLLARWSDKQKKTWFEAVLKVDLAAKKPKPELIGKFEGVSFAQGTIDSVLGADDRGLWILAQGTDGFGVARFGFDGKSLGFERLGDKVGRAHVLTGAANAWTTTVTPYGSVVVGWLDLKTSDYRYVSEVRGKIHAIVEPGVLVYSNLGATKALDLRTGALVPCAVDSSWRKTSYGLLSWSPSKAPAQAALYDESFRKVASWSGSAKAKPTAQKGSKSTQAKGSAKPKQPKVEVSTKPKPRKKG